MTESAETKEWRRQYRRERYVASDKAPRGAELRELLTRFGRTHLQGARICRTSLPTFERWTRDDPMPGAAWQLLQITCDPEARRRWLATL